eukprot:TRINITY_DN67740_c1_g6_i1.p1 TRINITY_DN67740_c1_g6~~TRINITY_DN67740_c1_g6_i1.p1  ORF type:complete len:137 (+),score=11.95 TRINITY_DN67740_c1_g6_i1:630-1040(+)
MGAVSCEIHPSLNCWSANLTCTLFEPSHCVVLVCLQLANLQRSTACASRGTLHCLMQHVSHPCALVLWEDVCGSSHVVIFGVGSSGSPSHFTAKRSTCADLDHKERIIVPPQARSPRHTPHIICVLDFYPVLFTAT